MDELLGKIVPQFEKENFQRKAWVALAKEDVPIEVFDANFSAVKEETHRVLVVNTTYRAAWTAEIGNDRQESYTDFETYYENIPYTDYETKYKNDTASYYIPARISDKCANAVREYALRIFRALGCRGLSRVDFFVDKNENIVFNEINTFPGFTNISMYPSLMKNSGMTDSEIIDGLIKFALE